MPIGFCCGGFSSTAGYVPGNKAHLAMSGFAPFKVFRNPKTRQGSFEILSRLMQNAPADIQPEYLEQLKNLIKLSEQKSSAQSSGIKSLSGQKYSAQDRVEVGRAIVNLQKIK